MCGFEGIIALLGRQSWFCCRIHYDIYMIDPETLLTVLQ